MTLVLLPPHAACQVVLLAAVVGAPMQMYWQFAEASAFLEPETPDTSWQD